MPVSPKRSFLRRILTATILMGGGFLVSTVHAQVADSDPATVTVAQLDALLTEVNNATELNTEDAASAKESLQQAKLNLQETEKLRAETIEWQQQTAATAELLQQFRERLKNTQEEAQLPPVDTLADAKSAFDQAEIELASARQELAAQSGEMSRRQTRLKDIPDQITATESELETARGQLDVLNSDPSGKLLAQLRELQLKTLVDSLRAKIEHFNAERQYYVATAELLPLQTQLLERQVEQLQSRSAKLKQIVESKRENEIDQLLKRAQTQLKETPEALLPAARLNVELVQQFIEVSKRLATVTDQADKAKRKLETITSDYKTSRERVEAVGLNETLGLMFRRSKSSLAHDRRNLIPDGTLQEEIQLNQVELFRLQDLTKGATETMASVDQLLEENGVNANVTSPLQKPAKELLQQRREILTPLAQTRTELFNRMVTLDTDRRKIVNEIDDYTNYINEHVLWIRSGAMIGRDDLTSLEQAAKWLVAPKNWQDIPASFIRGVEKRFGWFVILTLGIMTLMFSQVRLRKSIKEAGALASARGAHDFWPTATALVETLLIAAQWPLVMFTIGWTLRGSSTNAFVQSLATTLVYVAVTIYPFEVLRQTCRTEGLGESHFDWPEESRKYLRSNLRWLIPVLMLLLVSVNLFQFQPVEEYRSSLGRAIMALLLLVPLIYVIKVLRPNSRFYTGMDADYRDDYLYRFRVVRFVVAIVACVALMIFTLGGFYYTTYQIGSRLLQTFGLLVSVVLAYGVSMRWLLVRRRRMKLEQLAEKREQMRRQQIADGTLAENVKVDLSDEPGIDASEVNKQARELLLVSIGLITFLVGWRIWADVIPAVGILDRVKLWDVEVNSVVESVTLQNLLYFLVAAAFTYLAVKNLPGLLELLLLKRLPMDAGARYAVATILRYIISVLGIVIACAFLKVDWSQFSWLVAAISLGLGFGLQEIVANFVSGLILLLERPVRIGDIVTIEGTTGVVSRIQMRATTVTNWDQQELVVPNKNLITNSIFNWTLSNVLTRITLDVGVAYGSDPEQVEKLITGVLKANSAILEEPRPTVIFQTFGDSSLNFVIRCCISGPDKKLSTIHALQIAINRVLSENNIEIPFPQRVVHSISPEAP